VTHDQTARAGATIPAPTGGAHADRRRTPDRLTATTLILAFAGLAWLVVLFATQSGSFAWGYDYRAYSAAATRLEEAGTLYQLETLGGPFRPGPYGLYMYAPPLGIAVVPLAGLGPDGGAAAWFLFHVAVLALACAVMPVETRWRLATFGVAAVSFAVTRDLVLGNVSALLLLPLAMAWRWLDRPLGSVAQALAMAVRPMLGVLIVWQLLRRQWRAVAWTLGAGALLIALTLPVVGIDGYLDYLTVLRHLTDVTGVDRNADLGSTALLLGWGTDAATVTLLAGYAMAFAAILLSLRRDRELGFIVTVTASLLLSPLLWDHYLSMLVLPAAFLAQRGRPWGLALPLLSWLPPVALPFVVLLAVGAPFLARDPARSDLAAGSAPQAPSAEQAPAGI
jgi:hypothetical protein